MSDAKQRLELEMGLAVRNFLEQRTEPPSEFHTVEGHSLLCAGRLAEDRAQCDCRPAIDIHVGAHRDCLSCHVIRH
jgi:hypothetical protein